MTLMFALTVAAAAPTGTPVEPVEAAPRVMIPPIDFGVAAVSQPGLGSGVGFEAGVEAVRTGPLALRAGISTTTGMSIPDGDLEPELQDDGWWRTGQMFRRITRTALELSPTWRPVPVLGIEAVGRLEWRSFRQQFRTIDTRITPTAGVGIGVQARYAGVRLRALSEIGTTTLVWEDGTTQSLSPFTAIASVYLRFPGTRDPFRRLATLPW